MKELLYVILKQIQSGITTLQGLAFVPQNGNSNVNGVKTFTSGAVFQQENTIVAPTQNLSPATKLYVDTPTPYPTNVTVVDGVDFDFNTLTNPNYYNSFTFTCSGATATMNHLLNIPHGCWIWINTGKTITFKNKLDANPGYIANFGGADFVAVGTNGDGGYFIPKTGYVQRTGGGNN